jgi:hypothetical protein
MTILLGQIIRLAGPATLVFFTTVLSFFSLQKAPFKNLRFLKEGKRCGEPL